MLRNEHGRAEVRRNLASWSWIKRFIARLIKRFEIDGSALLAVAEEKIAALEGEIREFDALRISGIEALTRRSDGTSAADILRHAALIPEVLLETRLALNWSQTELAKRASISPRLISRYEQTAYATVSLLNAKRLCFVMHEEIINRQNSVTSFSDSSRRP